MKTLEKKGENVVVCEGLVKVKKEKMDGCKVLG